MIASEPQCTTPHWKWRCQKKDLRRYHRFWSIFDKWLSHRVQTSIKLIDSLTYFISINMKRDRAKSFTNIILRFCHRSDGRHGFKKILQAVLCPTQLFQWKLICTFNQHCLSYKISNRLQFNSDLFFWKRFETVLHWHNFFQDVPHSQKTFKYIKTDTYKMYIFYGPYSRAH